MGSVQERIDALAERANNGALTDEERTEYEALIQRSRLHIHSQGKGSRESARRFAVAMDAATQELVRERAVKDATRIGAATFHKCK